MTTQEEAIAQLVEDLERLLACSPNATTAAIADAIANGDDPLLDQLRAAAHQRDAADATIRRLAHYARARSPIKYRLTDLADAAGMSISGIRTAATPEAATAVDQALN